METANFKNPRGAAFADVASEVCRFYGLGRDRVLTKRRDRELVDARHLIAYLCWTYVRMRLKVIAAHLSGVHAPFNHATIIHAVTAASNRIETDPGFAREVDAIKANLGFLDQRPLPIPRHITQTKEQCQQSIN